MSRAPVRSRRHVCGGGGVRSAFSAPAMARTMAAIQIAPPGAEGRDSEPGEQREADLPDPVAHEPDRERL